LACAVIINAIESASGRRYRTNGGQGATKEPDLVALMALDGDALPKWCDLVDVDLDQLQKLVK
jgi:hypothetical protein